MKWLVPFALASLIVVGCQSAPSTPESSSGGGDTSSATPSPRGPGEGDTTTSTSPDTSTSNTPGASGTPDTGSPAGGSASTGAAGGATSEPNSGSGGEGEATFAAAHAIIQAKCAGCHGANGKEGIDVRTYESLMKGGEHGPIITAGDPAGSKMVMSLKGEGGMKKMPFNQPALSPEEIEVIEAWIKFGAKQ